MASIDGTSGLQAPLLRRPPASCALARSCLLSLQRRAARPLVALLVAGIVLLVAVCGAHASPRPATNHGTATLDASALHTSTSGSASADELSISASMAVKGGIFDTTTGLDDIRSFIGFDYINASLATTLQAGVPSPLPLIAELDVLSNLASSKEFVWAYSDLSPSTASWLQQTSGDLHGFPIHALAPCQAIQGPFVSDRLENRAYQLGGVQAYESVVPPPTTVYSPFSLYAPFVLINGSDTHAGCSATEMVRIYLGANRTFTQPVAGLLLFGLDGDASVDAAMQAPYPGDPGQTPLFRIPNDLAGKLVHAMWTASALSASLLDSQATRAPTAASQILDPNEQRSNYGMTVHDLSRVMIAAPSNVSNTLEAPNLAFSAEPLVAIRLHMRVGTIASPADLAQFSATWKVIVPIVIILLSLLAVTVWLVYRRIQRDPRPAPRGRLWPAGRPVRFAAAALGGGRHGHGGSVRVVDAPDAAVLHHLCQYAVAAHRDRPDGDGAARSRAGAGAGPGGFM
ncbi:hypothetical protein CAUPRSCDRAFT_11728 [Caulochytrium protostelioides]|uniref:Uncharacterized protein n=1 Tax=Caulochytrium protostelioides TaxID=1555241 RepID=A0A4P9WW74_9FUNG|nr:hypothetical protein CAUPRSCDRAFT_11728 [Caulochytrium protostelioides]